MELKTIVHNLQTALNDSHLTLLFPEMTQKTNEKIIYRKNSRLIDKIIEFDVATNSKIKTTHYDYFNDKKIRSIDEFDRITGKKVRTINYVLYKSIDEFDPQTGKKLRTINFHVKDETKISSIQEYDLETGKITTILIYKRDGKTVSIIKKIDPITEKISNWVNTKNTNYPIELITKSYDNITTIRSKEDIASLIDNLYRKDIKFENI